MATSRQKLARKLRLLVCKIAQEFGCLKDFPTERNNNVYFRGRQILQTTKDSARARHTGAKFGLTYVAFFAGLLLSITASGSEPGSDPDAAWTNYLRNDTGLEPGYRFPHASCFRAAALGHGLPETLLLAVARGESDFDATARSRANAHGVMQILWPTTANHLGIYRLTDLYDPCTNIDAGARYLQEMLKRFDGNLHLALAAYNYGPERISANTDDIPAGASWYSGYIYRHLNYVLGERKSGSLAGERYYSDLGRSTLVSFGEPYRAAAFVERLETHAPALQLDWFRKGVGKFAVVLTYRDREHFASSALLLEQAGFPLD